VRSHQLPEDGRGFRKQHDGRCVTIFSASNYCGNAGNYGAVMVLASEHFPKYEIYEHYAAPLEELPRLMGVTYEGGKERLPTDQKAAASARWLKEVEKMMVAVIEKKPELWSHLVTLSKGNWLEFEEWEDMLVELVEPNLPWKQAAKHWNICAADGSMDVGKWLSRWVVTIDSDEYNAFLVKAVKHVFEAILGLDMDLEHTLLLFDADGDGTVELKELRQVLGMFNLGLTSSQLDRLTGHIFTHCTKSDETEAKMSGSTEDGSNPKKTKLNVQEFLKHLTVVYKQSQTATDQSDPNRKSDAWAFEAVDRIGRLILKTPPEQLIEESDITEAALKIQKLYRGMAARKDLDQSKTENGGQVAPTSTSSASSRKTLESRTRSVFNPEVAGLSSGETVASEMTNKMMTLFSAIDKSGDGVLQIEEFVTGVQKLPGIGNITLSNGSKLDYETLMAMARIIDVTGNGDINYLEFLKAFSVDEGGQADITETLGEDITTTLFRHRHAIRMGCHYLDEDASGFIRAQDFETVLQGVNSALSRAERSLTNLQISLLVEAMSNECAKATTANGGVPDERLVDYEFFLKSFVIIDLQNERAVVKKYC